MSVAPAAARQAGLGVRAADSADRSEWDRFVSAHREATVSHLYDWRHVIEGAYGRPCFPLLVRRGGELRGVLPLVWMKSRLAGNRLVSMPFLDRGGPLARSEADAEALWRRALDVARRLGARGLDLRGPAPGVGVSIPGLAAGSSRARFVLDLRGSREELWQRLSAKVRNQIRKSDGAGLFTRRAAAAELPCFHRVFARNMRDLGSPVHGAEFFRRILSVFGPRARLYLTRDARGAAVAGGLALHFAGGVTVPWASALRSARPSCPNHSLYWRILRDAAAQGAREFDFGRSAEGSGSARFKRQWGTVAEPLSWSSFDLRGRQEPERIWAPSGHARLVWLWRHLPLAIADRLGPVIRGRLPN